LFTKYLEEHQHNSKGILKWHIHKKMKESKTKEKTVEELLRYSPISLPFLSKSTFRDLT